MSIPAGQIALLNLCKKHIERGEAKEAIEVINAALEGNKIGKQNRMSMEQFAKHGGKWLGAVRSWIQWNCINGSDVIWGSLDELKKSAPFRVKDLEDIAALPMLVGANMKIRASSLESAIRQANEANLPTDSDYIDGSFEINQDIIEEYIENQIALECIKVNAIPQKELALVDISKFKTNAAKTLIENRLKGKSK